MANDDDRHYLQKAALAASRWSHDSRTQNGAILRFPVGGYWVGANVYPIADWKRHGEPPEKLTYIEHAERVVIYGAAREGHRCCGADLYCIWFACPDCAKAIIQAGIRRVVGCSKLRALTPDRWRPKIEIGDRMLEDAGVEVRMMDEPLGVSLRFDGVDVEV